MYDVPPLAAVRTSSCKIILFVTRSKKAERRRRAKIKHHLSGLPYVRRAAYVRTSLLLLFILLHCCTGALHRELVRMYHHVTYISYHTCVRAVARERVWDVENGAGARGHFVVKFLRTYAVCGRYVADVMTI